MAPECIPSPALVSFLKTTGPTLGIAGAALAWLLNKFLGWLVWVADRFINRLEVMTAIRAEIEAKLQNERSYNNFRPAIRLIRERRALDAPGDPFVPYVSVEEDDPIFKEAAKTIRTLPPNVIGQVVAYYYHSAALTRQLADFRSEAYRTMSRVRQERVFIDTFYLARTACRAGEAATQRLNAALAFYEGIKALAWATALVLGFAATALGFGYAGPRLAVAISAAVEWASTCDLTPSREK